MTLRLEKIDPENRQWRYYVMEVTRDLFGQWSLIREWGRIGAAGGQRMITTKATQHEAEAARDALVSQKSRRGYHLCPNLSEEVSSRPADPTEARAGGRWSQP